jgi:hypothetical protein
MSVSSPNRASIPASSTATEAADDPATEAADDPATEAADDPAADDPADDPASAAGAAVEAIPRSYPAPPTRTGLRRPVPAQKLCDREHAAGERKAPLPHPTVTRQPAPLLGPLRL